MESSLADGGRLKKTAGLNRLISAVMLAIVPCSNILWEQYIKGKVSN